MPRTPDHEPAAAWPAARQRWAVEGPPEDGSRTLPEETPVAVVHDASTYAVMMASPGDLEDFALGFSWTEGVIARLSEVQGLEVASGPEGVEVRLWLEPGARSALSARRRRLAGPTGCGLCGVDSLQEAVRPPARVAAAQAFTRTQVFEACKALEGAQALGRTTRAVHAAGLWRPGEGLVAAREDVGRHNALDKLAGALLREGQEGAGGVVVLTSRVSVEMVQKAAVTGAGLLAAVSAPTALAVRTAQAAGLTLAAVARGDSFEVYTHPWRVVA